MLHVSRLFAGPGKAGESALFVLGNAAEACVSAVREVSLPMSPQCLTSRFPYVKEPRSDEGNWK